MIRQKRKIKQNKATMREIFVVKAQLCILKWWFHKSIYAIKCH